MRRRLAALLLLLAPAALASRPPPDAPPPSLDERFDGIQADLDALKALLGKLKGKAKVSAEAKARVERALSELDDLEVDTRVALKTPPACPPVPQCPPAPPCPPAPVCPPAPQCAPCPAPPVVPLAVINAASDLCLGVVGKGRHRPGAGVEMSACVAERGHRPQDQQWTVVPAGNGYDFVRNEASGLCLGVRGVDQAGLRAEAEVFDCAGVPGDARLDNQWKLVETARGAVQLRNRVSNLCLSVLGGDGHGPGAIAVLDACDAPRRGRDGLWQVVPYAGVIQLPPVEVPVPVAPPVQVQRPPSPISQAEFDKVMATVDSQSFDGEKMRVLKLALEGKWVLVDQVKAVVGKFSFPKEKLDVVRLMNPTIVDRANRYQLLEVFTFDSDKAQLEAIIKQ